MSIGKFWIRTALVVFSIPIFYVLLFFLHHYYHLVLNIIIIISAVIASLEVENLFLKKGIPVNRYIYSILGGTLPLVTYLEIAGLVSLTWSVIWFFGLLTFALLRAVYVSREDDLPPMLMRISSSIFIIIYPGLFISFLVRLSGFKNSTLVLLFFFSLMFLNDIVAYIAGIFLGRKTRLRLLISPNKSTVGFIAGFLSSIGIALIFRYYFPELLPVSFPISALFGAGIGILAILGDLMESALKRSARVKDSGRIIPGRGGLLDSIDSWLISLPVFYFVLSAVLM